MPFAEHFMVQNTFTVPATLPAQVNINLGFIPTKVEIIDKTALLSMVSGTPLINPGANYLFYRGTWNNDFSTGLTLVEAQAPAASIANVPVSTASIVTANGISPYDGAAASPTQLVLGPKINGTTITKATGTFTLSSTASLFPGSTVLITNRGTGAASLGVVNPALGGMFFTVDTVPTSTTFTIANSGNWLNTASFTDGAQTFSVQLVTTPALYYPQNAQIVFISAANPAVVTTSTNTNLTVGQQVRLRVPRYFGMTQADGLVGIVSAVSGNQVTLGGIRFVNSSAFTAFSFNSGVAGITSVPYSPAMLIPMGSGPSVASGPPIVTYNVDVLDDATDNQAFQGFTVGSSILQAASATVIGVTAGDIISYVAWRGDV